MKTNFKNSLCGLNWIILLLFFLLFFVSFQNNIFGAASEVFFNNHQRDSESLVLGRVQKAREHGYFADQGFIGRYGGTTIEENYGAYLNNNSPSKDFVFYNQSFGLQGYFYYFLDNICDLFGVNFGVERLYFSEYVTAAILAIILTIYVFCILNIFGVVSAVLFSFLLAASQWVIVFANNLYWMFFLIMAPFVIIFYYLFMRSIRESKNTEDGINSLYILVFVLILLKCMAGYEYISSILISTIVPILFFGIKDSWSLRKIFKTAFFVGFYGLMGFFVALLIHLIKLYSVLGDWGKAFNFMWITVAKRTHGNPDAVNEVYRASLESSVVDVVSLYWNGYAINLDELLGWGGQITFGGLVFSLLILNLSISSLIFLRREFHSQRRLNVAIIVSLWFSVLAPLSWYILAKGHSYIHTHMNHVLWYVPFLLLGYVYFGFALSVLNCFFLKNKKIPILGAILAVVFIYLVNTDLKNNESKNFYKNLTNQIYINDDGWLKIYLKDKSIVYVSNSCDEILSNRFFLHIYPVDEKYLSKSRSKYFFDNFDFAWFENEKYNYRSDYINVDYCVAVIDLPIYPIKLIRTGQFDEGGRLWEGSVDIDGVPPVKYLQPFDFNDSNWSNGISLHRPGFFIDNNLNNRISIKIGDLIEFEKSGVRVIEDVQYFDKFINIYVSGSMLDSNYDGYPKKINILKEMDLSLNESSKTP